MFNYRIGDSGRGFAIINEYGETIAETRWRETAELLCKLLSDNLEVASKIQELAEVGKKVD